MGEQKPRVTWGIQTTPSHVSEVYRELGPSAESNILKKEARRRGISVVILRTGARILSPQSTKRLRVGEGPIRNCPTRSVIPLR